MDASNLKKEIEQAAWDGLVDSAEGLLTQMVDEAPIKQGTLRRSHDIIQNRARMKVTFVANTPYAEAVHEGSKPHVIKAKKGKALWWPGLGHPVRQVKHPGNRANPWMQRVIDRESDRVDAYILDRITEAIDKGLK